MAIDYGIWELPKGLCGNKADHEPHEHKSKSLGTFWCHADQTKRMPFAGEKYWKTKNS